jgi:hypothetical protein
MSELYERISLGDGRAKLRYNLHPGQSRAIDSKSRFVAIIAGTQGGKTSFEPLWLWREMQRVGVPSWLPANSPADWLAVTANYDLFKLKFEPELCNFFCNILGWGTYKAGERVIVGNDGRSRIILRSAVAEGGLESNTALGAVFDEAGHPDVKVGAWEAIQRRLSIASGHSAGRCLFGTTPYDFGWLYQQIYARWKGGDTDYDVVNFRSCDNPLFPQSEYERMKRTLPDWKFQMMYNGLFTRPAGLIYSDYDDCYREQGGNLVKPFSIPSHWLRDVGVDFGGSVHNAQIWIAEDPATHDLYAYREVCGVDETGPEQARAATEYKEPVRMALGGAGSEDDQRNSWTMAGFPVIEPFISEVEAGIDRVIGLFKTRRLYVFDTLTGLRSELGTYSRELDDAGEPLQKIKDKEKFHRIDALRYVCTNYPLDRPETRKQEADNPADSRKVGSIRKRLGLTNKKEMEEYQI